MHSITEAKWYTSMILKFTLTCNVASLMKHSFLLCTRV